CRSWRRSPELVQRTKKERLDGGPRRPEWRARNPHGGEGRRAWAIGREDRWWRDIYPRRDEMAVTEGTGTSYRGAHQPDSRAHRNLTNALVTFATSRYCRENWG